MKSTKRSEVKDTSSILDTVLRYLSLGLFIILLLLLFFRSGQYAFRILAEGSLPIGQPSPPVANPCQPLPEGSNDEVSYRYAYDALDRKCDE